MVPFLSEVPYTLSSCLLNTLEYMADFTSVLTVGPRVDSGPRTVTLGHFH